MKTRVQYWDGVRLLCGAVCFVVMMVIVGQVFGEQGVLAYDDSDAPPLRSGLQIRTDHLTGCQYLVTFSGAMQPRLQADGKQVCRAQGDRK